MSIDAEELRRQANIVTAKFQQASRISLQKREAALKQNHHYFGPKKKGTSRQSWRCSYGELKVCVKPWFPCTSRFVAVDQVAVGKARLKSFCTEVKCVLAGETQK